MSEKFLSLKKKNQKQYFFNFFLKYIFDHCIFFRALTEVCMSPGGWGCLHVARTEPKSLKSKTYFFKRKFGKLLIKFSPSLGGSWIGWRYRHHISLPLQSEGEGNKGTVSLPLSYFAPPSRNTNNFFHLYNIFLCIYN